MNSDNICFILSGVFVLIAIGVWLYFNSFFTRRDDIVSVAHSLPYADMMSEHISDTASLAEAIYNKSNKDTINLVKKLLEVLPYWELGHDWIAAMTEHIMAVGDVIKGIMTQNNVAKTDALKTLQNNTDKIVNVLKDKLNGDPDKLKQMWQSHLTCTVDYTQKLADGDQQGFAQSVQECIAMNMGQYLDSLKAKLI